MSQNALSTIKELEPLSPERLPDLGGRDLVRWKENRSAEKRKLAERASLFVAQSFCLLLQWLILPVIVGVGSAVLTGAWFVGIFVVALYAIGSFAALAGDGAGLYLEIGPGKRLVGPRTLEDAEREVVVRSAMAEWNARAGAWNASLILAEGRPTDEMLAVRSSLDDLRERLESAASALDARAVRLLSPAHPARSPDAFGRGAPVIDGPSGRIGRVADDTFGCYSPDEVPVAYEDGRGYEGTDFRRLALYSRGR